MDTFTRCPESQCAVQAAYIRFLAAQADEDDARLLVRAGLVEAIYRQQDREQPRLVGYRTRRVSDITGR
jgi:hypothetical protein